MGFLSRFFSRDPNRYTVKFGKIARTLEYDDAEGHILFTFDMGSKFDFKNPNGPGKNSLCLEHHAPSTPRSSQYAVAFERTKQYLESCGYEVEIYGE
jgi:hypothetical protein